MGTVVTKPATAVQMKTLLTATVCMKASLRVCRDHGGTASRLDGCDSEQAREGVVLVQLAGLAGCDIAQVKIKFSNHGMPSQLLM